MTSTMSDSRWEQVSAPYGVAALRFTHWLDGTPRAWEGVPGLWWAEGGSVQGRDLAEQAAVELAPFTEARDGRLLLRAFEREGALALRVYDPEAPMRRGLAGIESYPGEGRWTFSGHFRPAAGDEEIVVRSIDGYARVTPATGTVEFDVDGSPVALAVSRDDDGLFAVIADATAADGAYPFRFLTMPAPDSDGTVAVDFDAAALPPCAFSDQYVCPLPPPQNRLPFAVKAGERRALRS
jgi:uncharacterized protein (DUF1684 family)